MSDENTTSTIEKDVQDILALEQELKAAESALMKVDAFVNFLALKKKVDETSQLMWETIQNEMIANNVKSIKGDWGSVTIAEKLSWSVELDQLSPRFIKKVPDTAKLSNQFRLEGKAPKGATPKYTKYILKRLK